MREILVIRFGALGDLCVLGWALAGLADKHTGTPLRITLVTKAAFAPLMTEMTGVDKVIALEENSLRAVNQLAIRLRAHPWDAVLDAHNTLRSRLLLGLMGRRPTARLNKDTLARLVFMKLGRNSARLHVRMLDRFTDLISAVDGGTPVAAGVPPLAHLATPHPRSVLGLAPGAQWDTKRWPAEHYAELLHLIRAAQEGPVRIYLGPREARWFPGSALATAAAQIPEVAVVTLPDLTAVARDLAELSVLVTNDSGLLHLAEATGTRVLAFFGPTVREFGYFPLLADSLVLERPESCRPCSRNGKRACRRGDLICLRGISPHQALTALQNILAKEMT